MEDFKFLMEAYVGKTALLAQCEDLLDEMIDKSRKSLRLNMNKLPENKKIEELLCEQFGFRGISLYWTDTSILGPAYTICGLNFIQTLSKDEFSFLKDDYKQGFYDYQHEKFVVINISGHILNTYKDLTAEHIMAMILHEIGHNFSTSVFNIFKALMQFEITALGIAISELASTNPAKQLIHNVTAIPNEIINIFPAVKEVWFKIRKLHNMLLDILEPLNVFVALGNIAKIPLDILFFARNISQKMLEIDSDSIAGTYGYGKDLAEALDILTTHGRSGYKPDSKSPLISVLLDMSSLMSNIYSDIFGTHPSNIVRLGAQINKLEVSLKRGQFEPNLEKELQSQIDELKYLIENYDKEMKHDNFHMSAVVNKMYAKQFLK